MTDTLVTVISPVFNGSAQISDTIDSVLSQSYSAIEYIIVDGNSSDNTLAVIKSYGDKIAEVISEPDAGMYDALTKGLLRAKGDVICYINAGDVLQHQAIQVVVDIFADQAISWITGYRTICNEDGIVTNVDLPFRYKSSLIRVGSYGRVLPFIQQESTFWRASLLETVNMDFLRNLKMAGDYYLWWCFSKVAKLEIVSSQLGVFKKHAGQMSERKEDYFSEIDTFIEKRGILDRISEIHELLIWGLHPKVRAKLAQTVMRFNQSSGHWEKK